jgi:hypothetical protein
MRFLLTVRNWLQPERRIAAEKRRLERVCKDCGTSRAVAARIVATYFAKGLRDDS